MSAIWQWPEQDPTYATYGNANQWTVNAGMSSLARESAQNSNDARMPDSKAQLVYSFIRLSGADRTAFLDAAGWSDSLHAHLSAMAGDAKGSVAAGQIVSGLESIENSDSIVLLRISDYGCAGLTGPEFLDEEPYGNFVKLCRLDLFSGKDKASGGSFGLGKAVYWRFSRLQTVLFNSTLPTPDPSTGKRHRVFGVNQGVAHHFDGVRYQSRGHFGVVAPSGAVASLWEDQSLIDKLKLGRESDLPGTTALLVGFYDPDQPDLGVSNIDQLSAMATDLRAGIEESFWPLLTRRRLAVRIDVIDGSKTVSSINVDPEETYTELVRALRRFDAGDLDDQLTETYTVVARDIPIEISKKKAPDGHERFTHEAKLVVTVSDTQKDTLENKVCLIRQPEMVVQTVDRVYEGRTFHAFLLAGASIHPDAPSVFEVHADDFLRFAEPPSHDRWIPGRGRGQASQANLNGRYNPPWMPFLQGIEHKIYEALNDLFSQPPQTTEKPPQSIMRHLDFLRGSAGTGGSSAPTSKKPQIDILHAMVIDGRWVVDFEVKVKNRPEGWQFRPSIALVGLDGSRDFVAWDSLTIEAGKGTVSDGIVSMAPAEKGRFIKAKLSGRSSDELPIPAAESFAEIIARDPGHLQKTSGIES